MDAQDTGTAAWTVALGGLAAACLILALVAWAFLPAQIVVHWGLWDQPSAPVGRSFLLILPGLSIFAAVGFGRWARRDGRGTVAAIGVWYWFFAAFALIAFLALEGYIVLWNLGHPIAPQFVLVPLLAVLFALIGELCVRAPPNRVIGFRTRATLGDEDTWYRVNRRFGRLIQMAALPALLGLFAGSYGIVVALAPSAVVTLGFVLTAGGGRRA